MHGSLQWLHIDCYFFCCSLVCLCFFALRSISFHIYIIVALIVYCSIHCFCCIFVWNDETTSNLMLSVAKQNRYTHTSIFITNSILSLRYSPSIEPWICQQPNNKIRIALFILNKQTPNMFRSTIFLYTERDIREYSWFIFMCIQEL